MRKETPGKILKKTRITKKISVDQVSSETKITSRYIKALEEDNYSYFPAPTYVQGFLTTYAKHLGLDPKYILQLYKNLILEAEEPPIMELTKPISKLPELIFTYSLYALSCILISVVIWGSIYLYHSFFNSNSLNTTSGILDSNKYISEDSQDIENLILSTKHIYLRSPYAIEIIQLKEGIDFILKTKEYQQEVYLTLDKLESLTDPKQGTEATMTLYPGRTKLILKENQLITTTAGELLVRELILELLGTTKQNIKLKLIGGKLNKEYKKHISNKSLLEKTNTNKVDNISNNSKYAIFFNAKVTGPNFIEIYIDGKLQRKGILKKGTYLTYQAYNSIQIKVGDASAMQININNKSYIWGRKGQQVSKIIQKIRDPLEQFKYDIVIKEL